MKRKGFILLVALQMIICSSVMGQRSLKEIEGTWMGRLKESGMELRMVFNFTITEADTLKATLDSPDQSAEGLPLGRVRLDDDTLIVDAPMLRGHYKGVFSCDSLITGVWTQLGKEYPLDLKRQKAPLVVLRPQEPKPPYPYKTEEVTFRNNIENFDLAGTLTLPEGEGPFPAVVLISGSGSQDRDETVFRHKPFWILADYLTRNGIAVLRYDDRGIGKSKGNMTRATSLTLADDGEAAVTYLLTKPEIDKNRIGLAGHSEGGLIAPIIASRNSTIAFIVSLAGPGVRGYDLIIQQNKDFYTASGMPEKDLEEQLFRLRNIFDLVIANDDQRKVTKDAMEWYAKELDKKGTTPEERKTLMTAFTQALVSVNNPWFRYFLATDPAEFWTKVKCPVLALNGERDLQVNYEQNLPAIKSVLKKGGNKKVTLKSLPMHNHLFQHCATGLPTEYASIEETFSPEAMEIIAGWIKETVKKKK